jgi:hypothetical protein
MGMDWLKGIVGASGRMIPPGQQPPPAWTPYGGAPTQQGGPTPPYAVPQPYGAPQGYAVPPSPYATPTPAAPVVSGPPIGGAPPVAGAYAPPPVAAAVTASSDARVAALEAQCAALRHDVESIALFARTLLTLLEDKQITTPEQFAATKAKLDALPLS